MVELANRRPRIPAGTDEVPIVVTRSMAKADSTLIANAILGQSPEHSGAPQDTAAAVDESTSTAPASELTVTSPPSATSTPAPQQRPTFVALPERQRFDFSSSADVPDDDKPAAPTSEKPGNGVGLSASGSTFVEKSNALNVLIVDDDPLTRKLMSRMLTRLGCICDTAENGMIALGTFVFLNHECDSETDEGGVEMLLGPLAKTPSSIDPPPSTRSESPAVNPHCASVGKYAVVFLDNQYVRLVSNACCKMLTCCFLRVECRYAG
jgi:CheY-like chemotaxis protein